MENNQHTETQEVLVNEFIPLITAWLKKWYN